MDSANVLFVFRTKPYVPGCYYQSICRQAYKKIHELNANLPLNFFLDWYRGLEFASIGGNKCGNKNPDCELFRILKENASVDNLVSKILSQQGTSSVEL